MTDDETIKSLVIDEVIYNQDVFGLPPQEFAALRSDLISSYLTEVENNCGSYRSFVKRRGQRIKMGSDNHSYIPTSIFKTINLLTVSPQEIDKWCVSSGTRGRQSRIGRDRVSLERLLGSVKQGLSLINEWDEEFLDVLHLGPSYEDAGDIWFPYVMSLTELLYPTESFGHADFLDIERAIEYYLGLRKAGRQVGIIGAPFAIKAFCEAIQFSDNPANGKDEVTVVTGGGWKTHTGSAISREDFRSLVVSSLGLTNDNQVRDAFNQVELNTVMVECEHHQFHIPPWLDVAALEPTTLEPLGPEKVGLLAYIDASAASYPCVFVGDDLGFASDQPCSCGRSGNLLKFERRLERDGDAGCAVALSERFAGSQ